MWAVRKNSGFTIVELLIVIVVIGILATIVTVAYTGISSSANDAKRNSDLSLYYKAILQARVLAGTNLKNITGSGYSAGYCTTPSQNPSATEPKDLPKTHNCWVLYYDNLNKIGAAAGVNLSALRAGDSRGNPYVLDENEGEAGCNRLDNMYSFTGNGVALSHFRSIPLFGDCS